MSQKILFPGWDNLSSEQKALAKKWIESLVEFKAASRDLLSSFPNAQEEFQLNDLSEESQLEIVDSSSTSEGIGIDEIVSFRLLDVCKAFWQPICSVKCQDSNDSDCFSNCVAEHCPSS